MNSKGVMLWFCVAIVLCILVWIIAPPVRAYPYIIQGQTINQTETYDMRSIYGFSGELGWWEHWYEEGDDSVEPDKIIDLNDMGNVRQYAVYIDPEIWNVGNWYQWDGIGKSRNGNTFVFRVNRSQTPMKSNITNSTVIPPSIRVTTTKTESPSPTKTPVVITLVNTPTPKVTARVLSISTPVGAKPMGIPFLPSSPIIPIVALLGVGLFLLRR